MQTGKTGTIDPHLRAVRLSAAMRSGKHSTDGGQSITVQVLEIESRFIKLEVPEPGPAVGERVELEFHLGGNLFHLDTEVSRVGEGGLVWLHKPESITKKRIRNSSRTDTHTQVHFTVWTEVGRFQGELLDISEDGLRMLAYHRLNNLDLINVDLFLASAGPGVRINTQATVIWSNQVEDGKNLFETGVQFQTLPPDIRARLNDYAAGTSQDDQEI